MKESILELLKEHPDGLMIKDIAKLLERHSVTVTKYIYALEGEKKIRIRMIGNAKMVYLKKVKK